MVKLSSGIYRDGVNYYGATSTEDGTYSYTLSLVGPLPWAISYKWGFTDSETNADIEEAGGGLGIKYESDIFTEMQMMIVTGFILFISFRRTLCSLRRVRSLQRTLGSRVNMYSIIEC